jgi:hypothetical protein
VTGARSAGAARGRVARWGRRLGLWGPVVVQMGLIFSASSIPDLKGLPGGLPDWAAHGAAYAVLAALVLRALAGGRRAAVTIALAVWAATLAVAYGVPGRSATLGDLAADAVGAVVAVAIAWAWCAAARTSRRAETGRARRV